MTVGTKWRCNSAAYDHRPLSRDARPQRIVGGAALACIGLACAWTLGVNLAGPGPDPGAVWIDVAAHDGEADSAGTRGDKLAVLRPQPAAKPAPAPSISALLFDPHRILGFAAGTFVKSASVVADGGPAVPAPPQHAAPAQGVASTPPRGDRIAQSPAASPPPAQPARTVSLRNGAHGNAAAAAGDAPAARTTLFEKLFGKPAAPVALAYAAPDDTGLGGGASIAAGRYDRSTAVYDISAHVVYMPDGTRLEAHSGLGERLDDPRYAAERNRGVTPPAIYDLEPREAPFHGVRALRLIPEDDSKVFGRSGLLAHSFMLGPNGDSNGCVSFKDYDTFLQAYENRQIKRLAVVTRAE
jgi:hypothetical protein